MRVAHPNPLEHNPVKNITDNPAAAPTRRTIVRGAAWSVPAIAVAVAAPMAAASTGVPARIEIISDSTQSIEEGVNLLVLVYDAEGNTVSAGVVATLAANPSAVFLFPDESAADGLTASYTTDVDGVAPFPIDASGPVDVLVTLTSGSASASTILTIVA
ncbi:hypothetical protein HQQ81_07585 [Microbacteriaceae bacterium VKM Ac-2854]|nr:hypothetical protein [Microbacteriaceae bacterium VKM Ac-2854]